MVLWCEAMSENKRTVVIEIDEGETKKLVEELIKLIEETEETKIKGNIKTKTVALGRASKRNEWKYILNLYKPNNDITVTLKRFEKQPVAYAILKLTDKVTEVEDLESFLNRMSKLYLLVKEMKKRLGDGREEAEEKKFI